jgi:hypothetical protein
MTARWVSPKRADTLRLLDLATSLRHPAARKERSLHASPWDGATSLGLPLPNRS